jgi:hypothetical protein
MGTRAKTKVGKTQRKMDGIRRSMANHGRTEDDTRQRDVWRKFWVQENHRTADNSWMDGK